MIVAGPALPHQSAIRIPQINANQSSIPDWKVLAATLLWSCRALAALLLSCAVLHSLTKLVSSGNSLSRLAHPLTHSPLGNTGGTHGTQQRKTQDAGRREALAGWRDTSTPQPGFVL